MKYIKPQYLSIPAIRDRVWGATCPYCLQAVFYNEAGELDDSRCPHFLGTTDLELEEGEFFIYD